MHEIAPIISNLIELLRGAGLSRLGDEIEAHIRLGKIELFDRAQSDENYINLRQRRLIGSNPDRADKYRADEDDDGQPYSNDEQVDETLRIISTFFTSRSFFVDDSARILAESFKLGTAKPAVLDADEAHVLDAEIYRNAAPEWHEAMETLRNLLTTVLDNG